MSGRHSRPSEIIELLAAGRWSEGLPWAIPALGALAAFFFWPLLIGILLGLEPLPLWGLVALFTVSALRAARPRAPRRHRPGGAIPVNRVYCSR
jgi:hypothetical protein